MSDVVAIIPARYASQRFPGKMLASKTGKPLLQHVYERVSNAASLDRVLIATDDDRIAEAARRFGAECVMTRQDHPNGTSRLAEAAAAIDSKTIVNVQGDEPELDPALIDRAVAALDDDGEASAATVAAPMTPNDDPADPNIVKVVLAANGRALYFSRAPIPYDRDHAADAAAPLRHIGLYVYRRAFLLEYVTLPPTPLERTESLEQLRILEHGRAVAVAIVDAAHQGIDTPEQYEAFVARHQQTSGKQSRA